MYNFNIIITPNVFYIIILIKRNKERRKIFYTDDLLRSDVYVEGKPQV